MRRVASSEARLVSASIGRLRQDIMPYTIAAAKMTIATPQIENISHAGQFIGSKFMALSSFGRNYSNASHSRMFPAGEERASSLLVKKPGAVRAAASAARAQFYWSSSSM
jgi:hypothetical protein